MLNVEAISFAAASALFLGLAAFLALPQHVHRPQRALFAAAAGSSALWAGVVTWQAAFGGFLIVAQLLELLRDFVWLSFLLLMVRGTYPDADRIPHHIAQGFAVVTAFVVGLMLLALYRIGGGSAFATVAGN